MDKAIRIEARQTMVNYRMPTSFLLRESFPLPPYSTVAGMVHRVCGFTEWRPMLIGVQGKTCGITSDLYTRYTFKISADREAEKDVEGNKIKKISEFARGVAHTELLSDVKLVLHVQPQNDEDFDAVFDGLNRPLVYPALGRHEDLLDITNVEIVQLEERQEIQTVYDMIVPENTLRKSRHGIDGTVYILHKEFYYDDNNYRRWKDSIPSRILGGDQSLRNFLSDVAGIDVPGMGHVELPVAFA